MDENTQQETKAEIASVNGELEAASLEAKIEATEQINAAETVAQVAPAPAPAKTTPPPAPTPKQEAKAAPGLQLDPGAIQGTVKAAVKEALKDALPVTPAAPPPAQEPAPKTTPRGEVYELTAGAFKVIKSKAEAKGEEKGRQRAMDEFQKQLQEAGFGSLKEALNAIKAQQAAPAPQQTAPVAVPPAPPAPAPQAAPVPQPQNNGLIEAELRKAQREKERLAKELEATRAAQQSAARKAANMAKKIEAMETDQELREVAIKEGVQDVDYAMTILQRNLNEKSEAELRNFNEVDFFKGLRSTHGYLFGERVEPASTSKALNNEPAPPPSATQTQRQIINQAKPPAGKQTNIGSVHSRLAELGLTLPSS